MKTRLIEHLPGVLPDSLEIHGEDLEYDNIFASVLEIFVFVIVWWKHLYLYLYNGYLPGVLLDPIEIHGEDLEDDHKEILDNKINKRQ